MAMATMVILPLTSCATLPKPSQSQAVRVLFTRIHHKRCAHSDGNSVHDGTSCFSETRAEYVQASKTRACDKEQNRHAEVGWYSLETKKEIKPTKESEKGKCSVIVGGYYSSIMAAGYYPTVRIADTS